MTRRCGRLAAVGLVVLFAAVEVRGLRLALRDRHARVPERACGRAHALGRRRERERRRRARRARAPVARDDRGLGAAGVAERGHRAAGLHRRRAGARPSHRAAGADGRGAEAAPRHLARQLTQLPDFSFTLWDWAIGERACPPGRSTREVCHEYFPHIGHAEQHSHGAAGAALLRALSPPGAAARCAECNVIRPPARGASCAVRPFATRLREAGAGARGGRPALPAGRLEHGAHVGAVGRPEFTDFGPGPLGDRTLGAAIAAYTGIIHGASLHARARTSTIRCARRIRASRTSTDRRHRRSISVSATCS